MSQLQFRTVTSENIDEIAEDLGIEFSQALELWGPKLADGKMHILDMNTERMRVMGLTSIPYCTMKTPHYLIWEWPPTYFAGPLGNTWHPRGI